MPLPRITVVTPSFEQARFLERTIVSVLEQGYPNLEYIIIDGASTDGSVAIIQKYAESLAHWVSEPDRGQAHAILKGFARATGEILCWLNSDDVFLPGALLEAGRYFAEHPQVEAVNGGAYVMDETGRPKLDGFWTYSLGVAASYSRFRWYGQDGVFQQSTLWRRSAYEAVGGINESLFFIMDKELFTRLAQRRRFARIPRLLAAFRVHPECKTVKHEARRLKEEAWFGTQYRAGLQARLLHPAIYGAYRLQSLCRKMRTAGAVKWGLMDSGIPTQEAV
ncbi:MAG: glycosyltransferase family 2 protein [Bryobacteraceae bacterium]